MDDPRLSEIIRLEETERDFESAIKLLTDLIQQDPTFIEAYIHLAADSGILRRFREAERYARTALKLDPQSGRARYYLACALRDQGWLDEASREMEQALALVKREVTKGTLAERSGTNLPLTGWYRNVEEDAMALRVHMGMQRSGLGPRDKKAHLLVKNPEGTQTYRNTRRGFELDVPEDWSLSSTRPPWLRSLPARAAGWNPEADALLTRGRGESLNVVLERFQSEIPPDVNELLFTLNAQDMEHTDLEFGRITVAGKEHVTARYLAFGRLPSKKYMILLDGIGYGITAVCTDREVYAKREKVWDQIAASLRVLDPVQSSPPGGRSDYRAQQFADSLRDALELRLARRAQTGLLYGRAYDAVEAGRYSQAHALLKRCLRDNPDHRLAHKEMAVVSKRLGNRRAALNHREHVKRLDPTDLGNRRDLVHLLAGSGHRKKALRELDELIALMPDDDGLKALKTDLTYSRRPNHHLTFVVSIAYYLFVGVDAWIGSITARAPWLAGFLCVPAAHFVNLAGRWVGLTRKASNWLTVALASFALAPLVLKGGLHIILGLLFFSLVFPILVDNALRDQRDSR